MNVDDIEIAPFDNLLVYKNGYTPEIVSKIISEKKLGGLRVFSMLKENKVESLDFLAGYDFLEKLDITATTDFDFTFLNKLVNLKKLSINAEGSNAINLSSLKKLEYLAIQWRKKITGLADCTILSHLSLTGFKEHDLLKLANLKGVTDLKIKTGSIESLDGVGSLINLQSLLTGNCKKLQSIKAINHLPKLEEFIFDTCPSVKDYAALTDLPNLQSLSLINCGNVESIKFIKNLASLSKLVLLGSTVIVDGDLLPAKELKSLAHKHYKHYNLKIEDADYNANVKSNLQKITNLFK
jgi:hypothetical protein